MVVAIKRQFKNDQRLSCPKIVSPKLYHDEGRILAVLVLGITLWKSTFWGVSRFLETAAWLFKRSATKGGVGKMLVLDILRKPETAL